MRSSKTWRTATFRADVACAFALLLASALLDPALAQPVGVDSQAQQLLKASTDFLAAQQQFSVDTSSTIEVVLASGQKIQFDHTTRQSVQRPNKLRSQRIGDLTDQVFYYDGKSLTLHNPSQKYFATVAAPGTLEGMLDFARESLDLVAPAGDLLYKNAFDILMQDVSSGFVVGKSVVEGVRCDHLAFQGPDVDWQIWIEEGRRPLPWKMVITTKDVINAPQFAVTVKKWSLDPRFSSSTFSFTPPKDAKRIEFLPLGKPQ